MIDEASSFKVDTISNTSRPSTPRSEFPNPRELVHSSADHLNESQQTDIPPQTRDQEDESSTSDDPNITEKEYGKENRQRESTDVIPEVQDAIEMQRDIETGPDLEKAQTTKSARSKKSVRDLNLVSWDGVDDPKNPKNWSTRRKWAAVLIVSSFTFISPVSSSMVAPAIGTIAKDLHITTGIEEAMTLSIFVLAYAVGPLFLGPLSELYGRVIVLQLANLLYLFFNLGCGLAQTKGQMMVLRFLSGLGGSAPLVIGGGVLSDLFYPEQRGRAISMYSLAPLLGPAIAPIAGGFITENTTWRWIFYSTSILDALIQVAGYFLLQETYPPILLHRKKLRLQESTGNTNLHTEFDTPNRTVPATLKIALTRPFRLIASQVIVQVLAVYMAYLYGIMYLVLSTFPVLWTDTYHESIGIGGLNFISLGMGFFCGAQFCAPLQDKIYRNLKARNNGVGNPEFRVPLMILGALVVPIGLFWYGWTAQEHTHWILPNIGAFIFSFGIILGFQCIQAYIVDSYTRFAASAIASVTVLRSLAGFVFPLFAPYMYEKLRNGWGNSLLAFIAIILGWPAPILLWKFGATLRAKSPFAAGG